MTCRHQAMQRASSDCGQRGLVERGEEAVPPRVMGAEHDVLQHAHLGIEAEILERARDAEAHDVALALGRDVACRRKRMSPLREVVEPGDAVEERRLAGAVRPDQPAEFAGADMARNIVERAHAAKRDSRIDDFKHHCLGVRLQTLSFRRLQFELS